MTVRTYIFYTHTEVNAESAEFEIVSSAGKIWSFGVSSSEVICPYIFVGVALFIAFHNAGSGTMDESHRT